MGIRLKHAPAPDVTSRRRHLTSGSVAAIVARSDGEQEVADREEQLAAVRRPARETPHAMTSAWWRHDPGRARKTAKRWRHRAGVALYRQALPFAAVRFETVNRRRTSETVACDLTGRSTWGTPTATAPTSSASESFSGRRLRQLLAPVFRRHLSDDDDDADAVSAAAVPIRQNLLCV